MPLPKPACLLLAILSLHSVFVFGFIASSNIFRVFGILLPRSEAARGSDEAKGRRLLHRSSELHGSPPFLPGALSSARPSSFTTRSLPRTSSSSTPPTVLLPAQRAAEVWCFFRLRPHSYIVPERMAAASSQLASLRQFSHCILYGTFGFRA